MLRKDSWTVVLFLSISAPYRSEELPSFFLQLCCLCRKKAHIVFGACICLFSFYNSHRLWKWWALHPICLQNDERCMRWRGVAEVGAPIVFQVKGNPVCAWFLGQRLKWKTFSARGLLRNRTPPQKNTNKKNPLQIYAFCRIKQSGWLMNTWILSAFLFVKCNIQAAAVNHTPLFANL